MSDERPSQPPQQPPRWRRFALHGLRVGLFVAVIVLIHLQAEKFAAEQKSQPLAPIDLDVVREILPAAASLADTARPDGGRNVLDDSGNTVGFVLQTSPKADHIIGFSGPTNTLLAFAPDNENDERIASVRILSSRDTRDHVAQVQEDETFLNSYEGLTWNEAAAGTDVDSVTGATLTSLAIAESIIHRLGGNRPSLRFPEPLVVEHAKPLFESAASIEQDEQYVPLWHVYDDAGLELGTILLTSPAADNIVGYQGPTEARIGFDQGGNVVGIAIGKSYDNEPYVTYVREEEYFLTLFNDLVLGEFNQEKFDELQVEGVSGATMTSMAVADAMIAAAQEHHEALTAEPPPEEPWFTWSVRDFGTAAVVLFGLIIALSPLRGYKALRIVVQVVLIVYLGFINGDMLSQAMLVGWAAHGVPWTSAGGLVVLTIAALLVPVFTGRNAYCTHICPHGAAQQLVKNRLPWRLKLSPKFTKALKLLPAMLLLWCIVVAMAALPFSLVDIEPFDAYVFRVAGWATITVAVVGLVASLFVPMAYCRFGCPTGAMLNFLRLHGRSDHFTRRDLVAVALVAVALGFAIVG